jgi:membrane-bound lytic murein transglycosylase D
VSDSARIRTVRYTVRNGDSLHRIANNFRVTVDQIREWNSLHGQKYLRPGQKLVMYVDVTAQSGG